MAEIYLHHRKDKRMYAQCYRQIVEKSPTAQSYILLGDAYMAIQGIDYVFYWFCFLFLDYTESIFHRICSIKVEMKFVVPFY